MQHQGKVSSIVLCTRRNIGLLLVVPKTPIGDLLYIGEHMTTRSPSLFTKLSVRKKLMKRHSNVESNQTSEVAARTYQLVIRTRSANIGHINIAAAPRDQLFKSTARCSNRVLSLRPLVAGSRSIICAGKYGQSVDMKPAKDGGVASSAPSCSGCLIKASRTSGLL